MGWGGLGNHIFEKFSQDYRVGLPKLPVIVLLIVPSSGDSVFTISPAYHQCVQHKKLHKFGPFQNLKMKRYVTEKSKTRFS